MAPVAAAPEPVADGVPGFAEVPQPLDAEPFSAAAGAPAAAAGVLLVPHDFAALPLPELDGAAGAAEGALPVPHDFDGLAALEPLELGLLTLELGRLDPKLPLVRLPPALAANPVAPPPKANPKMTRRKTDFLKVIT